MNNLIIICVTLISVSVAFAQNDSLANVNANAFKKFNLNCKGIKRNFAGGADNIIQLEASTINDDTRLSGQIDDVALDVFLKTPKIIYIAINKINNDGLERATYNRLATTTAIYHKGLEISAEVRTAVADYSIECGDK